MEMRLYKRAITDSHELHKLIERCHVVRIGFTDDEGMAIVPMNFGYEWHDEPQKLTLWLHSATDGRKARAWGHNKDNGVRVAFEMDCDNGVITGNYACSYSLAYESIMGTGIIHQVISGEDKVWGLDLLMQHMAPGAPTAFGPGVLERTALWRLDVESFSGKRRIAKKPQ